MPVPDFYSFVLPVLQLSSEGVIDSADAVDRIADKLALTTAEREEPVRSGATTKVKDRINWSVTYLIQAGLLTRPKRRHFTITSSGKNVLLNPPEKIDEDFLMGFKGFKEFRERSRTRRSISTDTADLIEDIVATTPGERVEAAFDDMNDALQEELLECVMALRLGAFKNLIIDLMRGLGYKTRGPNRRIECTDNDGFEGIIYQDALGLDIVYLQARKCAIDDRIGIHDVQGFAGAIDGRGTTKGVFVTTGQFEQKAVDYAKSSSKRLILIDGFELTRLLVEHGVGVREYRVIALKMIDDDYFYDSRVPEQTT